MNIISLGLKLNVVHNKNNIRDRIVRFSTRNVCASSVRPGVQNTLLGSRAYTRKYDPGDRIRHFINI